MKPVLLMTDSSEEEYGNMQEFDTVKEAQDYAATTDGKTFRLYTLFTVGTVGAIDWHLRVDTASNMRENTKAEAKKKSPRAFKAWTDRELQTLKDSYVAGTPIKDIAAVLNRTYNACYCKIQASGVQRKRNKA